MDRPIKWASTAIADLDQLWIYLAAEGSPKAAEKVVSRIYDKVQQLAESPGIGRLREDLPGAPHSSTVWPYLIIYSPLAHKGILVWRVIHGARQLEEIVRPPAD